VVVDKDTVIDAAVVPIPMHQQPRTRLRPDQVLLVMMKIFLEEELPLPTLEARIKQQSDPNRLTMIRLATFEESPERSLRIDTEFSKKWVSGPLVELWSVLI
jgi:hypothetical protein